MTVTRMTKGKGARIAVAAWVVPPLVLFGIAAFAGFPGTGIILAFVELGLYFGWNLDIVKPNEWQVIERAGIFHCVKHAGWRMLCMRGLIDRIRKTGSFRYVPAQLFRDSSSPNGMEELDFADGWSAPVDSTMWYRVGDPDPGKTPEQLDQDILAYTYVTSDADEAAVQIAEHELRPRLQCNNMDDANKKRRELADESVDGVNAGIQEFGLYLRPKEPLLIEDIVLSDKVKALREKALLGAMEAEQFARQSGGISGAIKKIAEDLGVSTEEAMGIWERERVRDSVSKTGANVTFIADGMGGINKMYDVGSKKK